MSMPAVTPVSKPDGASVALPLLINHTPPAESSDKVIAEPIHTLLPPAIVSTTGSGLIVTSAVVVAVPQPFVNEYEMVSSPAVIPVITPADVIVAFALLALHTPPVVSSVSVMFEPAHTVVASVIGATTGRAFIVIAALTDVTQPAAFVSV